MWSVSPAGVIPFVSLCTLDLCAQFKCSQMLTGAPACHCEICLDISSGNCLLSPSQSVELRMCALKCICNRRRTAKDSRNYTRGVNANVTQDDSCTGGPQWQIELQTDEIKYCPVFSISWFPFPFWKLGTFFSPFFAGKIPFSIRWMQLQLSNSCWSLDVLERCPSCHLI